MKLDKHTIQLVLITARYNIHFTFPCSVSAWVCMIHYVLNVISQPISLHRQWYLQKAQLLLLYMTIVHVANSRTNSKIRDYTYYQCMHLPYGFV